MDTIDPDYICDLEEEALDDFSPESYPDAEKALLVDLGYLLEPPAATKVLGEVNN